MKECPVILNNDAVTVIQYGDKKVQIPSIKKDVKTVMIDYKDGHYTVAKKQEKPAQKKKTTKKKETVEKTDKTETL